MSSGTLASRGSAAGSALALMDFGDISRQYIRAQALGVWGQGGEGWFSFVICTMAQVCARRARLVSEQPSRRYSASVQPEDMSGSATASIFTISSSEGRSMAKNKLCPGIRTDSSKLSVPGVN